MKIKLLLLTLMAVFAVTLSGCSQCGSGGTNSNTPTPTPAVTPTPLPPTPTPTPTATPTPTVTPAVVTGIPECDDLFAKFEIWADEKNKNGSKAEKIAVAATKLALIIPLRKRIDKMKPTDRDQIAASCTIAATQFEKKQRDLEIKSAAANTAK